MNRIRSKLKALLLIASLTTAVNAFALIEMDGYAPYRGIGDLVIQAQTPILWLYRTLLHPVMQNQSLDAENHRYHYLYRKGNRSGLVVMVHGILARKEFYLALISDWVKLKQPMPSIVVPDLLGHGEETYNSNPSFTIYDFSNQLARFIRTFQPRHQGEPLIVIGHSLGGGISILLKPFSSIEHDGLILISPAGVEQTDAPDFMSEMELMNGLPFDFASSEARRFIYTCFEPMEIKEQIGIGLISKLYQTFAIPDESMMRSQMFQDLIQTLTHMRAMQHETELAKSNLNRPVYLIWAIADQLFDRSRYEQFYDHLDDHANLTSCVVNGSHMWIYEHSSEAARIISEAVSNILGNYSN